MVAGPGTSSKERTIDCRGLFELTGFGASFAPLLTRQVSSPCCEHSTIPSVPSIPYSAPALQARSGTPKTPSFAPAFQGFQQFWGICFSLEVSPEAPITWGFGTVMVQPGSELECFRAKALHGAEVSFSPPGVGTPFYLRPTLRRANENLQVDRFGQHQRVLRYESSNGR